MSQSEKLPENILNKLKEWFDGSFVWTILQVWERDETYFVTVLDVKTLYFIRLWESHYTPETIMMLSQDNLLEMEN